MISFPPKIITRRTSSSTTKYTESHKNNSLESPRRYSIGIIPTIINARYLTNSVPGNSTSTSSDKPINTRVSADNQILGKKDETKISNNHHKNNTCNLAPSQKSSKGDRITSWSTGFDNLLNDSEGLRHFTTFLEGQYAVENIEFWRSGNRKY